ncbi:hypothetical protein EXT70_22550, partial [Dickeya dadantii]|nr:hypothetical protein [Dickeya dadantii]
GHNKCKVCARESRRMSDDEITAVLTARGDFAEGSTFKWASEPGRREEGVLFTCLVCKADPVLGKWNTFKATYGNFYKGQMPCRCGKKHIWEEGELKTALDNKASSVGLVVKSIGGTKMGDSCVMTCPVHGDFPRTVRRALHTSCSCPSCANLGHDIFYIHGVYDQDLLVGLKYGLTKANAKTSRLYLQNKKSIFNIRPVLEFLFDSPQDARDLETTLKSSLPRQFTKEEVSDGYTETCSASNLDPIISMVSKAGG